MDINRTTPGNTHIDQNDNLPGKKTWNEMMGKYHYLGFSKLTGKALKYVALLNGQWVALIGWGAAAFKNSHREKWIG